MSKLHKSAPDAQLGSGSVGLGAEMAGQPLTSPSGHKVKPWERCKEHGQAQRNVWACPGCLAELRVENRRLQERDASWYRFAAAVGESLGCSPSASPGGNGHIVRKLRDQLGDGGLRGLSLVGAEPRDLQRAAQRLLNALDKLLEGASGDGFRGWENGRGVACGTEVERARNALRRTLDRG